MTNRESTTTALLERAGDLAENERQNRAERARLMRQLAAAGVPYRQIAAACGIGTTTAFYAVNGRRLRLDPTPAPTI